MKELSIEEKAKAYDEAIKRAKELLEIGLKDTRDKRVVLSFFPELAESEDKKMIQYFKDLAPFDNAEELYEKYGFSHKDAIAWLEKKGEQKTDEWSEEDKKMIDTIIETIKMSIEDCDVDDIGTKARLSLEKERDWLKSLKDRVQPQPQQQWSEEDEDMRYKATAVINRLCADGKEYVWSISTLEKLFYWLKSLRPQSTWKPSEMEMKALEFCLEHNIDKDGVFGSKVVKLYEELKKLKG